MTLCACAASPAHAHFLFIRVEPVADGATVPRAEVFFSEQATAGDPKFVDKIDHTRLWQAAAGGEFKPLVMNKGTDRLTATLLDGAPGAVVGFCEYGVLTRDVSFLLRYYPKAIVGDPQKLPTLPPRERKAPEIMATFSEEGVTLTVVRDGKPLQEAVFTTVDEDLGGEELKADATGRAIFKPRAAGYYCVYTKLVTKQAGEVGGKAYVEILEFPTLAFPWQGKK
jgi:hypothetical protein